MNILANTSLNGRQACYLAYSRPLNVLYLVNDPGTALLPGQSLATSGTLSNSQCTVTWGNTPMAGSGNNLAITLTIAFSAAFSGNSVFYLAARDASEANNTGWQAMGTWTPNSPQYTWLSFIAGDPGVPGDGKVVTLNGGGALANPIPLSTVPNGFTTTVFSSDPAIPTLTVAYSLISLRPSPCDLEFGSAPDPPTQQVLITYDGVQGTYTNVPQSFVQNAVGAANGFRSGCNFTLTDLAISELNFNTGSISIDAAAIGVGLNAYPH